MNNPTNTPIVVVLATNNKDKVKEIKPLLENIAPEITVYSLSDLQVDIEIEETEKTLEGNARLKTDTVFNLLSNRFPFLVTVADDTGLEVSGLNGAPGVYSARFAPMPEGKPPTYDDNVNHLLKMMESITDRKALFRTVIALKGRIPKNHAPLLFEKTVEGSVEGTIVKERTGNNGFGYDPIFWVNSAQVTFAQMSTEEKNRLSHRSRAVKKAVEELRLLLDETP